MAIVNRYSPKDVDRYFKKVVRDLGRVIEAQLFYLGEQLVNHAREYANFTDQTGNLRNSIGYLVLKNGREIGANFEKSAKGESSQEGVKIAKAFARGLVDRYPTGYALIVVAGMEYAAAVEAKGYNVLTTAEQLAAEKLPEMKKSIIAAINRMAA